MNHEKFPTMYMIKISILTPSMAHLLYPKIVPFKFNKDLGFGFFFGFWGVFFKKRGHNVGRRIEITLYFP